PTVARTLGLRESATLASAEVLVQHLRERRLLLVLDNFEQVLEAAAEVVGVLKECPGVTVLATSREPLAVDGEHELLVPPLDVDAASPGSLEGVQLFVERARAVRADFQATGDDLATVAAICRRVDGLPLAIELAAAQVRVFPLKALHDRLGD